MLKTFKYASLFALSALTVACGSGGGGGVPSIPMPTPTPANNANNANNTANSNANNTAKPANPTNTQTTPTTPTTPAANNTNNQPAQPVEPVAPQQPVTPAVPEVPQQPTQPTNTNETTLDNSGIHLDKDAFPLGELNHLSVEDAQGKEIATLSGYNRNYAFNGALKKTTQAPTSLPEILVDKLVVKLAGKAGSVGGLQGYILSNTIGAVYNASKDPVRDVFYFGDETAEANMPKSGVVTYQGNASRYDNVSAQVKNIGTSTFVADFENKKIKGELAIDGLWRRNISLKEGDIRGNSFSGEAVAGENHALVTRYGEYEGKFYGPNAEELAGKATFAEAQKDLNTSFSAEQVK